MSAIEYAQGLTKAQLDALSPEEEEILREDIWQEILDGIVAKGDDRTRERWPGESDEDHQARLAHLDEVRAARLARYATPSEA